MEKHFKAVPIVHIRLLAVSILITMLIAYSDAAKSSCYNALSLCGQILIPSLFPFFVLSSFIMQLRLSGTIGKIIALYLVFVLNKVS